MNWVTYSLIAILFLGFSDIFRKLASSISNSQFANLIFQCGAFVTSLLIFLTVDKTIINNPKSVIYAFIGGALIAVATLFSIKALATGQPVSLVMPTLRAGGVALVAVLGLLILRDKMTVQTVLGLIFSSIGIYLLFQNK